MEYLCFGLVLLALVAVIGHGLWMLFAELFRLLFGSEPQPPQVACAGCGHVWPPSQQRTCPQCGLDPAGTAALELRELDATQRQLRAFLSTGDAIPPGLEQLQAWVIERRRVLTERPAPVPRRPGPARLADLPPLELLATLAECRDVRNLTLGNRKRLTAAASQLDEAQLRSLPAAVQLGVARLLRLEQRNAAALKAYRRLLETCPDAPDAARTALEAGRLAGAEDREGTAEWFLERALGGDLSPEERHETEALLEEVRPPFVEPIPEVVSPPVPAAAGGQADEGPRPRPPRRTLAEVLAAFMEQRNILWGEWVGGLLIVGCSIALVISLWSTLQEQVPYFPFIIFAGVTAALFGAGLYTLHHWKLESTSRGLLVIAALLVPLNFLVMAGLIIERPSDDWTSTLLRLAIEGVALAAFAFLVGQAARVLTPEGSVAVTVAILGVSAGQLLVPRLLGAAGPRSWNFALLAALPVLCQGGAAGALLAGPGRRRPVTADLARSLFAFLGMGCFALAVALGLLIYRAADLPAALEQLAPWIALAGITPLLGGLVVHRGLAGDPTAAGARTVGTGIALAGMTLMLAAVVLAWPQPGLVALVCALDFAVLTVVAFRSEPAGAHVPALVCLAIGYLTIVHLLLGDFAGPAAVSLGQALLSAGSGVALTALVVLLALVSEWLWRSGRHEDATWYALGSAVFGLASLALVTFRPHDPGVAAVVYGVAAVTALAVNLRWRRPLLGYVGLALVLGATLWGLDGACPGDRSLWALVVAVESLVLAGGGVVLGRRDTEQPSRRWLITARPWQGVWRSVPAAAWRDLGAASGVLALLLALSAHDFPDGPWHTGTAAALAATAFLLAWSYRHPAWTWAGSVLLLGGWLHLLIWNFADLPLLRPWLTALLAHATAVLLVVLPLKSRTAAKDSPVAVLYTRPLLRSVLVTALLAVPFALWPEGGQMIPLAEYASWLAGLLLVLAVVERRSELFTAFEAAMTATVLFGVSAWLDKQPWVVGQYPGGWFDLRSLQAYGLGLGGLGLLGVLCRLALRPQPVLRALFAAPWPTAYRTALGVLLVVGQFAVVVWGVLPGILRELAPVGLADPAAVWPGVHVHAYGSGAWVLLVTLAALLLLSLVELPGEDWSASPVLGLMVLVSTAPLLLAGRFAGEIATASALRWWAAGLFLAVSAVFWLRVPLGRLAFRYGIATAKERDTRHARRLLLGGTVAPVLLLTVVVALLGFSGLTPTGPAPVSFFAHVGWVVSNIVPLVVVGLGLVGHALRERSPGYAFAAGLVAAVSVAGGYALAVVTGGGVMDAWQQVRTLQLGTITAAAWATAWLLSRRWVRTWREDASPTASKLMTVQVGLAVAGNLWLLGVAVAWLLDVGGRTWITAAGTFPGWLALALTGAAGVLRARQQGVRLLVPVTAGTVFVVIALLACTLEGWAPGWGYRTLLLGSALHALLWSLAPAERHLAAVDVFALAPWWGERAAWCVGVAGGLAVLLGLKAAIVFHDHFWAAVAVAVAGGAGTVAAVRLRREDVAFIAGLGINLAAMLVAWHVYLDEPLADWWPRLVQANAAAVALVAVLWLSLGPRLYGQTELTPGAAPLLGVQVLLGLLLNAGLLALPLLMLVLNPTQPLSADLALVGDVWGWLALLLAWAAGEGYANQLMPRARVHLRGFLSLAVGVLAACLVNRADRGSWLSYHILLAAWAIAAAGIDSRDRRPQLSLGWLLAIGLLVVGLAVRGAWEDPDRPYWSAGATLAVSVLAGILALTRRLPGLVYASGLLVNVVGGIIWIAWGEPTLASFGYTQALCFGLAAAAWSVLALRQPERVVAPVVRGMLLPFPSVAAAAGLCLLGLLVGAGLITDIAGVHLPLPVPLAWSAWAALVVAATLGLWLPEPRSPLAGLYALGIFGIGLAGLYAAGILGIGLALHSAKLGAEDVAWYAVLALAAQVLLAAAAAWTGSRYPALLRRLHLTEQAASWDHSWFLPAQALTAGVAVVLGVWLSAGFDTVAGRLAGPVAVAGLLAAAVLLAEGAAFGWGSALRYAALGSGALLLTEMGWALLGTAGPAPRLQRAVLLLAALAFAAWGHGAALTRLLAHRPDWVACARRAGPVLGGVAVLVLLFVLGQEALFYQPAQHGEAAGRTPLVAWAIALVIAGVLALIAAAVTFALFPQHDPLGLSERGRTLYVYGAELLLFFLFVHLKLTVPELFGEFGRRYWPFILMGIAFVGVGLSEYFGRRGLRVLAEPLQRTGVFLPLLPLLVFWARPSPGLVEFAHRVLPGSETLLNPLVRLPANFDRHALLWLLLGVLYGFLAAVRRSFLFALLAALAANFGLWALLVHFDVSFLVHPQLWVIPLALIVLAAEQANRDRLSPAQAAGLRYVGLGALYVASTADMFITGLGNSVVLPLVLAGLSVSGVLVGILLRVQAFLFLGVAFLCLVIFAMIWHAAVDRYQTWVWWASGIVLGVAILGLFALFEKRRNDVLRLIDEVRRWD
jgi:hypothetical protein